MADNGYRAVVTGIGVIASNGLSREEFFKAITEGKSGIGNSEMLQSMGTRSCMAGEVKMKFPEPLRVSDAERTVSLAYKVLDEAFEDSGLTREDISELGKKAGISFSTSLGGNYWLMKHVRNKFAQNESSPEWLIDLPSCTTLVSKYAGVKGPVYTTISACASGTGGASIALDLIRSGKAEVVIILGADPLTDFSAAGFHSLKCMSATGCRPYESDRDGMTMGEGATAIIVESLNRALERNAHIYGEILGYGIGNDAYHMTSPNPDGVGAYKSMRMALKDAGISENDIDYINTHGTATELNDDMEIRAISKLFEEVKDSYKVAISSTKSMTGHCLGAAGSVELAVILLAVDRGEIPPTSTLINPDEAFENYNLIKGKSIKKEVKKALSNSFGFGGHNASIVVGRYEG